MSENLADPGTTSSTRRRSNAGRRSTGVLFASILAVGAVGITAAQAIGAEGDAPTRACAGTGTATTYLTTPVRLVDSRKALGVAAQLQGNKSVTVPAGALGSGAIALIANITVAGPQASGYLTAWPGGTRPTASTLNFTRGDVVANGVQLVLSQNSFQLVSTSATHVIVDITGTVSQDRGALRIVADDEACRSGEREVALSSGTGPEGPVGATGPAGPEGPRGPAGVEGAAGVAGAQGPPGPQGDTGSAGATGATGEPGAKGDTGDTGAAGAVGPEGPRGPAGVEGAAGVAGAQGPPGPQGDTGSTGATGATGEPGAKGDTGARGPSNAFVNKLGYFGQLLYGDQALLTQTLPAGGIYVTTATVQLYNSGLAAQVNCYLGPSNEKASGASSTFLPAISGRSTVTLIRYVDLTAAEVPEVFAVSCHEDGNDLNAAAGQVVIMSTQVAALDVQRAF